MAGYNIVSIYNQKVYMTSRLNDVSWVTRDPLRLGWFYPGRQRRKELLHLCNLVHVGHIDVAGAVTSGVAHLDRDNSFSLTSSAAARGRGIKREFSNMFKTFFSIFVTS